MRPPTQGGPGRSVRFSEAGSPKRFLKVLAEIMLQGNQSSDLWEDDPGKDIINIVELLINHTNVNGIYQVYLHYAH